MFVRAGEVVACGTSNPLESPHLLSVRPLAVVAGQANRLVVKGFNLTKAATRQENVPRLVAHDFVSAACSFVHVFLDCCSKLCL